MKKIMFLPVILLITGCSFFNCSNDSIISNMGIKNTTCEIIEEKDTHSGFLGDGEYFAKIKCDNLKVSDLTKSWYTLPLSEPLKEATELEHCNSKSCENIYERYNIPNIENGYYYFKDRHSESTNTYDDTDINNRPSYNFTFAILDKDTNTIYYYELDT